MYCFDTDIVSALIAREPPLGLIRRLAAVPPGEGSITSITLGEVLFGVEKRGSRQLRERVERIIVRGFSVRSFDRRAAEAYGPLRLALEHAGEPIGEPDMRIASIALSRDLTLVTGNVRHFERVPGLRVENWLEG